MRHRTRGQRVFSYDREPDFLKKGLIGHWTGGGSGRTWIDRSGRGKHGSFINTPQWTVGYNNNRPCLQFAGSNDIIEIFDSYDPTSYTISMWINPSTIANKNIIVRTDATLAAKAWSHQLRLNSDGTVTHYLFDGSAESTTSTTSLSANRWYHLVGTVVGNGGYMRIYINGLEDGTPELVDGTIWQGGDRWYIATDATTGSAFGDFAGKIDDVRLYNRALSPSEIYWLANNSDLYQTNVKRALVSTPPTPPAGFAYSQAFIM